jgi:hypothetical protein
MMDIIWEQLDDESCLTIERIMKKVKTDSDVYKYAFLVFFFAVYYLLLSAFRLLQVRFMKYDVIFFTLVLFVF